MLREGTAPGDGTALEDPALGDGTALEDPALGVGGALIKNVIFQIVSKFILSCPTCLASSQ